MCIRDRDSQKKSKRPGILIAPEWWGINSDMKAKALKLAQLGYVVLVADFYGQGLTTDNPDQAGKYLDSIQGKNKRMATTAFMSALFKLKNHKLVNSKKIAIIGYSFGGGLATDLARNGLDVKAVINFHGAVLGKKTARPGFVKAHILWLKGEHDSFIDKKMEDNFRKEMTKAHAKFKIITYKDTFHSFTFKDADRIGKKHNFFIKYHPLSDKQSWNQTKLLLKRVL